MAREGRCQCDKAGSRPEVENTPRIAAQPAENPRPFDCPIAAQPRTHSEALRGFDQAPAAGLKQPRGRRAGGPHNRAPEAAEGM